MLGPQTTRRTPNPPPNAWAEALGRPDTEDIFSSPSSVQLGRSRITRPVPPMLGQYQILKQLGKGGMARVFLAEHAHMRRRVAIKVLPDDLAQNRAARERFYREARTAAALDHPNIVRAYDVREADGFHFLVMEYVEGYDLEAIMQQRGCLGFTEAVGWIIEAAKGLEHAATKNIVHRDIKPSNLLLDKHGTIKILDMGLARFCDQAEDRVTDELDSGAVMCTPDYAAPEQVVRANDVDTRADIYSLGATLYALLAGRPPFEGSVTMKLVAHQSREAVPLQRLRTDIPPQLAAVVAKMMAKRPEQRYQTPTDVIRALTPWRAPKVTTATLPKPVVAPVNEWDDFVAAVDHERPKVAPRDSRRVVLLSIATLLPLFVVVALLVRQVVLHAKV